MNFLFALGLVFCLFQIGSCYQCFECNGLSTSSCGVEFDDETTEIKYCDGDCLKFRFDANGQTFYRRECAGKEGCDEIKKDSGLENFPCQTCSGNYCNNGP